MAEEEDFSGQDNPIPIIIFSAVIIIPISSFSLYKYIKAARNETEGKTTRFMYLNQIIFYVSCIIFAIVYPLNDILIYLSIPWRIIFATETLTHGLLQFYALINIFYARLLNVFHGTPFQLTKKTRTIFTIFYIIFIILGIISWVVIQIERNNPESILLIIISIPYLFIMIIITQFLSFIFVYKLYKINRSVRQHVNGNELRILMQKFTILSIIAMSGTLAYIMFIGASSFIHGLPIWLINMAKQIDIATNILCLSLSYQFFDGYYRKCCYICDKGCQSCCKPSIELQMDVNDASIQSPSSRDKSEVTSPGLSDDAL